MLGMRSSNSVFSKSTRSASSEHILSSTFGTSDALLRAADLYAKVRTGLPVVLYSSLILLQAESAAPSDALYSSNLSAALYELGDYAACFQAICRATNNLSEGAKGASDSLFLRLSLRLAKSLRHGVRSGTISSVLLGENITVVEKLSALSDTTGTSDELRMAWTDWAKVESEMTRVSEGAYGARVRLSGIPILKKAAYVQCCCSA